MAKLVIDKPIKGYVTYYCQGCNDLVTIPVGVPHKMQWKFNGDLEHPTLHPSIRSRATINKAGKGTKEHVCHHVIKDGHIHFLSDCTHDLAGQFLWMEDIPSRYGIGSKKEPT